MKKSLALFLCIVMFTMLGSGVAGAAQKKGSDYSITFICMALGDMSFADSGKRGMEALASDYGFKTKIVEGGVDSSKYESYVIDICEESPNFVLSTGEFQDYIEKVAPEYPDIHFMVFDVGRDAKVVSDNILYVSFAQNEGSFLVGMIAAAVSKSGVIGTVGGVQNPVICDFMTGYVEGAKAVNPNIKVVTSWVGNWTDSAKMLELCTQQHDTQKADVFFPVAGGAGLGAFDAAIKIKDTWAIGVDSDQYALFAAQNHPFANVILTSMLKEVGNCFISVFKDFLDGKEYWGTVRVLGIKDKGVDYVNNEMLKKHVPADVISTVESTKASIVNGSLAVKSYVNFANENEYAAYMRAVAP